MDADSAIFITYGAIVFMASVCVYYGWVATERALGLGRL